MIHISWPRMVPAVLISVACFGWAGTMAERQLSGSVGMELDHFIPREKWEVTGLTKLTGPEQQTLANEITGLVGAVQVREAGASAPKDRSQWRSLQRRMSKEEVRKLLGEPTRISVSRFFEVWNYSGGSVTFDGKGRVDSWSEP
jgi:hypothetical protein